MPLTIRMLPALISRRPVLFGLLLCGGLTVSPLSPKSVDKVQESSKEFVISRSVDLVVLPVSVRNREGRFVSGLQAADFRVYEDGHPQEIALFEHEDLPVAVGLVVDHSGSMAARQVQVILGAQAFVHASNPQNEEFVVDFGDTVSFALPRSVPFTNNVGELISALSTPYASGRTALYDAIIAALQHARESQLPKKVLMLISDGGDNSSQHTLKQALQAAQASNVVIYAIGLLDEHSADQNPSVLKKLAADTGGQAYFPNSLAEIIRVCQQIAADIRQQYTLGYSPPETDESGYHTIRVKVTAQGQHKLFVRTRTGYFLPARASAGSATK